jgi:predicted phage terminase large subunit-like protein
VSQKSELIQHILTLNDDQYDRFVGSLTLEQKATLSKILTPKWSRYIPSDIKPMPSQLAVLCLDNEEILLHGSGGGSKSWTCLMGALQWADHPLYSGLYLMKTFPQITQNVRLMKGWLYGTGAEYNSQQKTFTFPEGGTLQFGNLDDPMSYKGSQYQNIFFDELTRFNEDDYLFLFSRLRKSETNPIPLRIMSATNPNDQGLVWVRNRFIDAETRDPGTLEVSFSYTTNSYLDRKAYERSLDKMNPIERAQMRDGSWWVGDEDAQLRYDWLKEKDYHVPDPKDRRVRVWDIASTEISSANRNPDFTAGALCSVRDGVFVIEHVEHFRGTARENERRIVECYKRDEETFGAPVPYYIEVGVGSAAKLAGDQLVRNAFSGMIVRVISSNIAKEVRMRPFASAAENGVVEIVKGKYCKALGEEMVTFGKRVRSSHDDILDSISYAFNLLVTVRGREASSTSFSGSVFKRPTNRRLVSNVRF